MTEQDLIQIIELLVKLIVLAAELMIELIER